jgi:hypothetical protein
MPHTDRDGPNADVARLEHDVAAAGHHILPKVTRDVAGHKDVLHLAGSPTSASSAVSPDINGRARLLAP